MPQQRDSNLTVLVGYVDAHFIYVKCAYLISITYASSILTASLDLETLSHMFQVHATPVIVYKV